MYGYLYISSIPHLLNIHALNVHTSTGVKAQLIHTPYFGNLPPNNSWSQTPLYPSSHPRIPYKTPCQRRIEDACGLVSLAGGALLLANQVRQLGHLIENRLSLGHLCAHLTHRVHHGRVVAAAQIITDAR